MKVRLILAALAALGFLAFMRFRQMPRVPAPPAPAPQASRVIVIGADSMVNIAQAWAEGYGATIEVKGGGSGIGFASLIDGTAQIAMSSREPEVEEMRKLTENFGGPPVQTLVAYDVLAAFVNKANPVERITFDELRGIYFEGGRIDDWKQLGVANTGAIVRLGRMSGSGVGVYNLFRTTIGGRRSEFRTGSKDFPGSAEVVTHCAKTPAAICYAALGYAHDGVKPLAVAKDKDGKPALPTPTAVRDGSYPLGRKLYFVTSPKADAATKKFVEFVTGPNGQKMAVEYGLISLAN
jgi:phosphate transport system substrate-binding protein